MKKEIIYVGPLSAVETLVRSSGVRDLVTLINNETMIPTPAGIVPDRHLRLAMNDIVEDLPGMVPPNESHVAELIDFALTWRRATPMLIHCWAGISRSTAAAFVALCALNPRVAEVEIARALRAASPTATPNMRLVELGDAALGREGRMTAAVESIGAGHMAMEAQVFSLDARLSG